MKIIAVYAKLQKLSFVGWDDGFHIDGGFFVYSLKYFSDWPYKGEGLWLLIFCYMIYIHENENENLIFCDTCKTHHLFSN